MNRIIEPLAELLFTTVAALFAPREWRDHYRAQRAADRDQPAELHAA